MAVRSNDICWAGGCHGSKSTNWSKAMWDFSGQEEAPVKYDEVVGGKISHDSFIPILLSTRR